MSPVVSNGPSRGGIDSLIKAGLNGQSSGLKQQSKVTNLQGKLLGDIDNILNTEILFVHAQVPYESATAALKAKYIRIGPKAQNGESNGHQKGADNGVVTNCFGSSVIERSGQSTDDIPSAKVDIFPVSTVKLEWLKGFPIGLGLRNQGNTCFLNSIMQALTYTSPLVNFLLTHHQKCSSANSGFCSLCELRGHITRALCNRNSNESSISPTICSKVKLVMKSYNYGRQEDAHEFLRYLIDSMQTACLAPYRSQKLDMWSKQTTAISRIFGGYHKNEIVCLICQSKSITFDPFLDLSLEIKGDSVEKCLQHFTRVETLQSENAYQCARCRRKTSARKCYSVHCPPNILTLQIKRFSHFGKVSKPVDFSEKLNLRPFMSVKEGSPVWYNLYAVVVHAGGSMHSGHYYSYVKGPDGHLWHVMDDSRVCTVGLKSVLSCQAYLLFYSKAQSVQASDSSSCNGRQSVGPNIVKGVILNSDERHIGASIGPMVSPSAANKSPQQKAKFQPLVIRRPGPLPKSNIRVVSAAPSGQPQVIKVEPVANLPQKATKLVPYDDEEDSETSTSAVDTDVTLPTTPVVKTEEVSPLIISAPTTGIWSEVSPVEPARKLPKPPLFIPPILLKKRIKIPAADPADTSSIPEPSKVPVKVEFAKPLQPTEVKTVRVYRERKLSPSGSSSPGSTAEEVRKSREKQRHSASPATDAERHKSKFHRHDEKSADSSEDRSHSERRKRKLASSDDSDSSGRHRRHHKKEKKRRRDETPKLEVSKEDRRKEKRRLKKQKRREEKRGDSRSPSSDSRKSSSVDGSGEKSKSKWNTSINSDAMVVEREESVKPKSIDHNRFSVLEELKKGSCNAGLGPSVKSWNGESNGNRNNSNFVSASEDSDDCQEEEEKRQKRKKLSRHGGSGHSNLFQKVQEERRHGHSSWE